MDDKLATIRSRLRELQAKEEGILSLPSGTQNIEATVEAALAQVRRFAKFLAQGSIVEQKELMRGFIAGITIAPSKDRGVITGYDLPALLSAAGGDARNSARRGRSR